MTEILLIRKLGKRKAGTVLDVELDGYWESHVAAGNAKLLADAPLVYAKVPLVADEAVSVTYDYLDPEDDTPPQVEDDLEPISYGDDWDPED